MSACISFACVLGWWGGDTGRGSAHSPTPGSVPARPIQPGSPRVPLQGNRGVPGGPLSQRSPGSAHARCPGADCPAEMGIGEGCVLPLPLSLSPGLPWGSGGRRGGGLDSAGMVAGHRPPGSTQPRSLQGPDCRGLKTWPLISIHCCFRGHPWTPGPWLILSQLLPWTERQEVTVHQPLAL